LASVDADASRDNENDTADNQNVNATPTSRDGSRRGSGALVGRFSKTAIHLEYPFFTSGCVLMKVVNPLPESASRFIASRFVAPMPFTVYL
jgi:hypothetical protein